VEKVHQEKKKKKKKKNVGSGLQLGIYFMKKESKKKKTNRSRKEGVHKRFLLQKVGSPLGKEFSTGYPGPAGG